MIIESSVQVTIELNWNREVCLQSEIVEDKLNGNMSLLLEKSWRKSCTVFGNFCRKGTILTFYGVLWLWWWGWSLLDRFYNMEIHRVSGPVLWAAFFSFLERIFHAEVKVQSYIYRLSRQAQLYSTSRLTRLGPEGESGSKSFYNFWKRAIFSLTAIRARHDLLVLW